MSNHASYTNYFGYDDFVRPGGFTPVLEREFRELDHMDRWQVLRVQRKQTVAAHTWLVSVYALRIAEMVGWEGDFHALYREAIFHDLDETITGDLPRTYKTAIATVPGAAEAISAIRGAKMLERFPWWQKTEDCEVRLIVHLADTLESLLYLYEEKGLGNNNVRQELGQLRAHTDRVADSLDQHFAGLDSEKRPKHWHPGWALLLVNDSVNREAHTLSMAHSSHT